MFGERTGKFQFLTASFYYYLFLLTSLESDLTEGHGYVIRLSSISNVRNIIHNFQIPAFITHPNKQNSDHTFNFLTQPQSHLN